MSNKNFTGIVAYDDIKKKYKDFKGKCEVDTDCPDELTCLYKDYCYISLGCKENDLTKCFIYKNSEIEKYNGNCTINEDCITNSCINNKCSGRIIHCSAGSGDTKCGLEMGETCESDNDCYERNCKEGICERHDMWKQLNGDLIKVFIGVGVLFLLGIIVCVICCPNKRRRRRRKY